MKTIFYIDKWYPFKCAQFRVLEKRWNIRNQCLPYCFDMMDGYFFNIICQLLIVKSARNQMLTNANSLFIALWMLIKIFHKVGAC